MLQLQNTFRYKKITGNHYSDLGKCQLQREDFFRTTKFITYATSVHKKDKLNPLIQGLSEHLLASRLLDGGFHLSFLPQGITHLPSPPSFENSSKAHSSQITH